VVVDEFTGGVCVEYVRDAGGGEREGLCLLVDGDGGRCGKVYGSAWCVGGLPKVGPTLVRHGLIAPWHGVSLDDIEVDAIFFLLLDSSYTLSLSSALSPR
jgi:hypothetical protein